MLLFFTLSQININVMCIQKIGSTNLYEFGTLLEIVSGIKKVLIPSGIKHV